jgi:hypothetical protein
VTHRAAVAALVAAWVSNSVGCFVREGEPDSAAERAQGEPVQFTFGTLDGQEVSSDTTRGRTTALLFVTTYDLPSQAEAQLLRDVLATHKPRANGAIVMMEPPRAAELALVWARSINVRLPIAMASPTLMSGESELGRINGVPTLVVLDRRGRVLERREGALTREEIAEALARAEKP